MFSNSGFIGDIHAVNKVLSLPTESAVLLLVGKKSIF